MNDYRELTRRLDAFDARLNALRDCALTNPALTPQERLAAPIGDEVATKLAALINRYYGPRYVWLALNKASDIFQWFWKIKRPSERTPDAADRFAGVLINQIETNTFELEWMDYRNSKIFEF